MQARWKQGGSTVKARFPEKRAFTVLPLFFAVACDTYYSRTTPGQLPL